MGLPGTIPNNVMDFPGEIVEARCRVYVNDIDAGLGPKYWRVWSKPEINTWNLAVDSILRKTVGKEGVVFDAVDLPDDVITIT